MNEWESASPVKPVQETTNSDRLPPHSTDAEKGILGCILVSPEKSSEILMECLDRIPMGCSLFYDLTNRLIYEYMCALHDKGAPVDLVSLQLALKDGGELESVGGLAYLASLPDTVPSYANLGYYIDIALEKYSLRIILGYCTEVSSKIHSHTGDTEKLVEEIETDFRSIFENRVEANPLRTAQELVVTTQTKIEQLQANAGKPSGIATGFIDLDAMTGGLQQGEMTIIAARPSQGKSAIAMNIADHVAVNLKIPVGVFSLEMTAESLMMRMMCSRSKVPLHRIRDGLINHEETERLAESSVSLSQASLYIDDSTNPSLNQLHARASRLTKKYGIKFWIIDYLQLLQSGRKLRSREEEITDISSGLKRIARDLNVAVLALSQLNRELTKRKPGSKPQLADLRGSGSIEQDADVVGLLHRVDENEYNPSNVYATSLIIAKQRNGPTGEIPLVFMTQYTRFETAIPPHLEDVAHNFPEQTKAVTNDP